MPYSEFMGYPDAPSEDTLKKETEAVKKFILTNKKQQETRDKICRFIAYHLPVRILYWASICVGCCVVGGDEHVDSIGVLTALDRFRRKYNL